MNKKAKNEMQIRFKLKTEFIDPAINKIEVSSRKTKNYWAFWEINSLKIKKQFGVPGRLDPGFTSDFSASRS